MKATGSEPAAEGKLAHRPDAIEIPRGSCGTPGCTTAECPIEYGYCHCGCGEKTRPARQTCRRNHLVKDEPQRFVTRHQAPLMAATRWAPTKGEIEARRTREKAEYQAGLGLDAIAERSGRSRSTVWDYLHGEVEMRSSGETKRKHPDPGERVCGRAGCEHRFRPDAHAGANGKGLYCSRGCADKAKIGRDAKKVTLTCAQCGRERHVRRWYVERGQRFCSSSCWGRQRAKLGLIPVLAVWKGAARRGVAGRRKLAEVADLGRRSKGATAGAEMLALALVLVRGTRAGSARELYERLIRETEGASALLDEQGRPRAARDPVYKDARRRVERRLKRGMRDAKNQLAVGEVQSVLDQR